jgi:hypothetical protein
MAANDSIDTLNFNDTTVVVIYHDTDVQEIPDSVLVQEIQKRGDDLEKYLHGQNYGSALVSFLLLAFVVYAVIKKKRNKNG